jgi:hypothetical protein
VKRPVRVEEHDDADDDECGTTVHMSLELVGFECPPAEISAILGLVPTYSASAGEARVDAKGRTTGGIARRSIWSIGRKTDIHASLGEQLTVLLAGVRGLHARFASLPPMKCRRVRCTVIRGGRVPPFRLGPDLTGELAALGLSLDINFLHIIGGPSDEERETLANDTRPAGA